MQAISIAMVATITPLVIPRPRALIVNVGTIIAKAPKNSASEIANFSGLSSGCTPSTGS